MNINGRDLPEGFDHSFSKRSSGRISAQEMGEDRDHHFHKAQGEEVQACWVKTELGAQMGREILTFGLVQE